jgi:hypothetical protein
MGSTDLLTQLRGATTLEREYGEGPFTTLMETAADKIEALTKEADDHVERVVYWRNEAARLRELANAVRDSQGLPFDNRVSVDLEALCKLLVAIPDALSPHPSGERG